MPENWNGCGHVPYGWTEAPAARPPAVTAIRFDNWFYPDNPTGTGSLKTNHTHRQPTLWEPGIYQSDPTGGTIMSPAREQEIVDNEILLAAGAGLAAWAFLWYPLASIQYTAEMPYQVGAEHLMRPWERYHASANKNQLQWCWIAQSAWLGTRPAEYMAWMAATMDDQYFCIKGRPLVYLFRVGSPTWDASTVAQFRAAIRAAGKGNPYFAGAGFSGTEVSSGVEARNGYGPLDHNPSGSGHGSWATHAATDIAVSQVISSTLNMIPHLAPVGDQRPVSGDGVKWWDRATCSQFAAHLNTARTFIDTNPTNCPAKTINLYSWTELAEWGGIVPTAQNDINGTGRGDMLDALAHFTGKAPLASTWNSYQPVNLTAGAITITGAGWAYNIAVSGAFDSNTLSSATTSDAISFTRTTIANGKMRVYGKKGPAEGIMSVVVDGGAPSNVDCYAAVAAQHQLLFETAALTAASHTVACTVTGTRNGASSANTITLDEFRAQEAIP